MHRHPPPYLAGCLVALSLAASLTAAAADTQPTPLPVNITLGKECGADRNIALPDRPVAFCGDNGTSLAAQFDAAAVVGRRLTVTLDLDPDNRPDVLAKLSLASFNANWTPLTSSVTFHPLAPGRLRTSIYVPADARSVWWALVGAPAGPNASPAQLKIAGIDAQASAPILVPGATCAPCKTYLDNAIKHVRTGFLFKDKLDLVQVERELGIAATGAQDVTEMDPVLKLLALKLNEAERAAGAPPHSYYQTRAEVAANAAPRPIAATAPAAQGTGGTDTAFFDTRLLDGQVGYLRMRSFSCPQLAQCQMYARDMRAALAQLHNAGARRWVIDLRPHEGGNMWPALAALRPLLGAGSVGAFVDAAGHQQYAWKLGASNAPLIGQRYVAKGMPTFGASREPAAVLVGERTSSSGEMIATAFQGRPATRSFGAPSSGYTTNVYNPPDAYGNLLGIATTYIADRNGRKVFPRVLPDVPVAADAKADTDATLDAALAWLAVAH